MDKQKVIVVLLLVTIVLSLASVFVTLGVDIPSLGYTKIITNNGPSSGSAQLVVLAPTNAGGNSS